MFFQMDLLLALISWCACSHFVQQKLFYGRRALASSAELTSLAHSSAIQAKKAAQNQLTAGSQAAFGVTNTLAQSAQDAAATAQAALTAKHLLAQQLENELEKANAQLESEVSQYNHAQRASLSAQEASRQATQQVNTLSAALAAAQTTAAHSAQAAAGAANAAATQHAMILEAKQVIGQLSAQLQRAWEELQDTEASAQRAASAAEEAKANAVAAADAVAVNAAAGGHHHGLFR